MGYPTKLENETIKFSSVDMTMGGNRPEAVKATNATETILEREKVWRRFQEGSEE